MQCEFFFFFLSGWQSALFTTWHQITHNSRRVHDHRCPSGPQASKFMLSTFDDSLTVALYCCSLNRTAAQLTRPALHTLGVNYIPLLLVADLFPPASEPPSRLFCPPPQSVSPTPACSAPLGFSKPDAPNAALVTVLYAASGSFMLRTLSYTYFVLS